MYFKLGILFIAVNHVQTHLVVFGLIQYILNPATCRYMYIADRRSGFIASPTYQQIFMLFISA